METTINLYEDNAGHLYLHRDGDTIVYTGLEHITGGTFAADASALATGDTGNWTIPTVDYYPLDEQPDTVLIATWQDGAIALHQRAARAGRDYLGVAAE